MDPQITALRLDFISREPSREFEEVAYFVKVVLDKGKIDTSFLGLY